MGGGFRGARARLSAVLVALAALSACAPVTARYHSVHDAIGNQLGYPPISETAVLTASGYPLPANAPILDVVARMRPVVVEICQAELSGGNCQFVVAVDDDPSEAPNAFQTLDAQGRPVVVFTQSLLDMARNADELAFVMGHEAAHHIAGHIPRRKDNAVTGAILVGIMGQASGLSGDELARAQEIGAGLAAQQYSKEFELEADSLGATIAHYAGYDPIRGAQFFARLPDPGERLMGSHPANAERLEAVHHAMRAQRYQP